MCVGGAVWPVPDRFATRGVALVRWPVSGRQRVDIGFPSWRCRILAPLMGPLTVRFSKCGSLFAMAFSNWLGILPGRRCKPEEDLKSLETGGVLKRCLPWSCSCRAVKETPAQQIVSCKT